MNYKKKYKKYMKKLVFIDKITNNYQCTFFSRNSVISSF